MSESLREAQLTRAKRRGSRALKKKHKQKKKRPSQSRVPRHSRKRPLRFLAAPALSFAARRKTIQMPTPLCGTSRRKLPGYVSRGWRLPPVYTHTHTDSCNTERARKSDTEGLEKRTVVAGGCGGAAEGCCYLWTRVRDPFSYPTAGWWVLYLALLRRAPLGSEGVLAAPELLTLSVTHFHFIICPLHPRIAPRRPTVLGITLERRVVAIPQWRLAKLRKTPLRRGSWSINPSTTAGDWIVKLQKRATKNIILFKIH